MLKNLLNGIAAGILISIGGCVYLACEIKIAGAVLFSVALLCICYQGYSLYTGKIGFIVKNHNKEDISQLLLGLAGNAIGTFSGGILISLSIPELQDVAILACDKKLSQLFYETLIRSFFCGILMYLAVSLYKEKNTPLGIFFCVPVFIISGFEHCIANMFYFSLARIITFEAIIYIAVAILGNSLGAMLLPVFSIANDKKEK